MLVTGAAVSDDGCSSSLSESCSDFSVEVSTCSLEVYTHQYYNTYNNLLFVCQRVIFSYFLIC